MENHKDLVELYRRSQRDEELIALHDLRCSFTFDCPGSLEDCELHRCPSKMSRYIDYWRDQ